MSAFVMSQRNILNIANTVKKTIDGKLYNYEELSKVFGTDPLEIARSLYRVNEESVNYRYNENSANWKDLEFGDFPEESVSTSQQIKNIRCWLYQSCETPEYKSIPEYAAMDNLSEAMMRERLNEIGVKIKHGKNLASILCEHDEEYKNAKWD